METHKIKTATLIALLLIVVGISMRLIPHAPNFVPVGAIALFSGAMLGWRTAAWLPLLIMMASDLIIGFYPGILFTWTGFILVAMFGALFRQASFTKRVTFGALGSGLIFFIVSNFGTWIASGMYSPTFAGLLECYYMALPFLRTSLLADATYSIMLFGAFAVAIKMCDLYGRTNSQSLRLQ